MFSFAQMSSELFRKSPVFAKSSDSSDHEVDVKSKKLSELLRSIESDVAARNFIFVMPMPKEVQTECSICLNMLDEPYIVECCGYRFCRKCIVTVTLSRQPCPLCKSRSFQKLPDKQLQRLLNQRDIHCLLKDDGCKWQGEISQLSKHLQLESKSKSVLRGSYLLPGFKPIPTPRGANASFPTLSLTPPPHTLPSVNKSSEIPCDYVPVSCTLCSLFHRRVDMCAHKDVCPMREVTCEYCKDHRCPYKELTTHYELCPLYPVSCPNLCNVATFYRKDLESHLKDDCPLQKVDCEYHYAGCEACMIRKEMLDHMEKNTKEHLSLVSSKYQRTRTKYKALKEHAIPKVAGNIEYLHVSNLSECSTEGMLCSLFGQTGTVTRVHMIPFCNAAIVEMNKDSYARTLERSYKCGINLLRHRLRITPIYDSSAAIEPPLEESPTRPNFSIFFN